MAGVVLAVVDDDESVRESLPDLLRTVGFAARTFASAEEFLASDIVSDTGCLILDIAMRCLFKPFSDTALLQAVNAGLRGR